MEMERITLEQLPEMMVDVCHKLDRIEKAIASITNAEPEEELITISEASKFLKLAQSTIYGKACKREIPVIKKGKRLYFEKKELLKWVKSGNRETSSELFDKASDYINKFSKPKYGR